jgi:hypothetical protein
MKTSLVVAGALLALACISPAVAVPISGSIGFNGTPTVTGGSSFATSTTITSYTDTTVAGGSMSGAYAGIPATTAVTFNPFQYNTPVVPVTPLWTFVFGGLTYSLDALTMVSQFSSLTNTWNIAGTGTARITGFDATPGTYTFTLTNAGAAFSFASTATASRVPDGGTTALMVGFSVLALGLLARKQALLL